MNYSFGVSDPRPPADDPDAKLRLINAALEIFGLLNLEGATTRELAARAGVNQSAIPYYFGGKEGLYLAAIQHIIATKGGRIQSVLLPVRDDLQKKKVTPKQALAYLKAIFGALLEILIEDQATISWGRIVVREQMQPTKAFALIYEQIIRHVHEMVSTLLSIVLGKKPTDPNVVLRAHTLVGQILIFLSGRETIRRRLNWEGYNEEEVKQIRKALFDQLDLMLGAVAEVKSPSKS